MTEPIVPAAPAVNPRRRFRNYLLDARFQLKAVLLFVGFAALLIALLGGFLWTTSRDLLGEAERAVEARSQAAQTSRELGAATLNNELVKRFDDPAFLERLRDESKRIDARYQAEKDAIVAQHALLLGHQQAMTWGIFGGLLALMLLIAIGTVMATHRIVGPVFRLKRLMQQVGVGELKGILNLRKGDELQDLFLEFKKMIGRLHDSQGSAMDSLRQLIERARAAHVPADVIEGMEKLHASLKDGQLFFPDVAPTSEPKEGGQ